MIGFGNAKKNLLIDYVMELTTAMHAILLKLVSAKPNQMYLSSFANASLTRYRRIHEMDTNNEGMDLTLAAFDHMSLQDIDFITLS